MKDKLIKEINFSAIEPMTDTEMVELAGGYTVESTVNIWKCNTTAGCGGTVNSVAGCGVKQEEKAQ